MLSRNNDIKNDLTRGVVCLIAAAGCACMTGLNYKLMDIRDKEVEDWGDFSLRSSQYLFGAAFALTALSSALSFSLGCYKGTKQTARCANSFFKKEDNNLPADDYVQFNEESNNSKADLGLTVQRIV